MKWYGKVGYAGAVESAPGVWQESITEREYCGDITRSMRRLEGSGINDDVGLSNEVSIVADPFAYQNFAAMRYVCLLGAKWKVTSVEVQYPRLILTCGGLYNEGE